MPNLPSRTGKVTRPRGRPALRPNDPSVNLHLRLPGTQYDACYARARAAQQPLAAWLRRVLQAAAPLKTDR